MNIIQEIAIGTGLTVFTGKAFWSAGKYASQGADYISRKLQPEDLKLQAIVETQFEFPLVFSTAIILFKMLSSENPIITTLSIPLITFLTGYVSSATRSVARKWREDYV